MLKALFLHLPTSTFSGRVFQEVLYVVVLYFQPTCKLAAVFTDPFHRQNAVFKQTKTYKTNASTVLGNIDVFWEYKERKKERGWFCFFFIHGCDAAIQLILIAHFK